jgi:DNA modification methylase
MYGVIKSNMVTHKIIISDNVEAMRLMPPGFVDLVVTSPPYDGIRHYGKKKVEWDFELLAHQIQRVLKPGGVLCWNVGDQVIDGSESYSSFKQAIHFKEQCGLVAYDTMIWRKSCFSMPDKTRYYNAFEYVFVFTKGQIVTFNPIEDVKTKGQKIFGASTRRNKDGDMEPRPNGIEDLRYKEFTKRSNVWDGHTAAQENPCKKIAHPAKMPYWLARDLVRSFSNPGDTVLDPFGGSGTSGKAALSEGRSTILIEKLEIYLPELRASCETVTPSLL